jgi:hypothetical protein
MITAKPPEVLVGGAICSGQELSIGEYVIDVASGLVPRVSCENGASLVLAVLCDVI